MATIQTTQLEERETGDIKQLRDHDIAEGPVSTNSADATSLKSVPLTLEDGSIIKVRFDSLVTAIGQALGASEDSTVTKVLGLNGTVPKGINMANLASVLGVGVKIYKAVTGGQDANLLTGSSEISILYYVKGSFDPGVCHLPSSDSNILISIPFHPQSSMVLQLSFIIEQNLLIMRSGTSYGWQNWVQI